jgi:hypothetical protein
LRRTNPRPIVRALGALAVAGALLACGGGDDDGDESAATTDAPADETTTTAADDESTTTAADDADDASAGGDGACPLSADEVSEAIGAEVQAAQDQVDALFAPDVIAAADVLCVFSSDGGFTPPLVALASSDDPEAEAAARSLLDGEEQVAVDGVGDQAVGDGGGQLVFQQGDTWSVVVVAVSAAPSPADQDAAIALAHLLGG